MTSAPAKVICFASAKGGTGKTVLAASFAKLLSMLGKKVLIVDSDASTNGLSLLFLDKVVESKKGAGKGARGVFEIDPHDVATPCSIDERVDLVPSMYKLRDASPKVVEDFRAVIGSILLEYREAYDYIILDSQAGTGRYSRATIAESETVVIVTEYDPVSAEGIERMRILLKDEMPPDKTWILVNKILPEFAKAFRDFFGIYRYLSPIPFDTDVMRAYAVRSLAIDTEKGNPHTLALLRALSDLLGSDVGSEIDEWKSGKEAGLKQPIGDQLDEIEQEIFALRKALSEEKYDVRFRELRRTRSLLLLLTTALASVVSLLALLATFVPLGFSTLLITSALAVAIVGGLLAIYWLRLREAALKREVEVDGRQRALEERLEYLNNRRNRYRALLDSDMESLLSRGKETLTRFD